MLLFKVKNRNVTLFAYKHEGAYSVVSSDLEGHEDRLAEGLNTLQELEELVAEVFNNKATCYGIYRGTQQLAKIFECDKE